MTTVLTARRIVRLLPAGDPARRFWRAYGFAALAVGIGYLIQLIVTARGPVPPALMLGGPVTAALLGVAALTVVIVMCTYPLRISSGRARACFSIRPKTRRSVAARTPRRSPTWLCTSS